MNNSLTLLIQNNSSNIAVCKKNYGTAQLTVLIEEPVTLLVALFATRTTLAVKLASRNMIRDKSEIEVASFDTTSLIACTVYLKWAIHFR